MHASASAEDAESSAGAVHARTTGCSDVALSPECILRGELAGNVTCTLGNFLDPIPTLDALAGTKDTVGALEAARAVGHHVARLTETLSVATELEAFLLSAEVHLKKTSPRS